MSTKSPLLSLGVAALSAYGAYFLAGQYFKKPAVSDVVDINPLPPVVPPHVPDKPIDPPSVPKTVIGRNTIVNPITPATIVPAHVTPVIPQPVTPIAPTPVCPTVNRPCDDPPQPKVDRELVGRVTDRMGQVASQANAQRVRWRTIAGRLSGRGMNLRAEIQTQLNLLESSLDSAESALTQGNPAAAGKYLDTAEEALANLAKEAA